jgi:tetratricopeptide (TPR) repeat protein
MMKYRMLSIVVMFACLSGICFAAQNGQALYQQALVQERAAGNLERAIELFQSAAKEAGGDRELAAKALIGAARCYEKLGETRSRELYELVARSYPDQSEQAAVARERLASSPKVATPNFLQGTISKLNDRLALMLTQAIELARNLTPQHPQLVNLRAEIAAIQEQLRLTRERTNVLRSEVTDLLSETRTPRFDINRPLILTGTVKAWEFVNPNAYIHLDVQHGNTTSLIYHVTGDSPAALTRLGVKKDMIRIGDVVTVSGFPALDGSPTIGIATVTVPGGAQIFLGISALH